MLVELESTAQSFELFLGQLFMGQLAAAHLLLSFFRHCDDPDLLVIAALCGGRFCTQAAARSDGLMQRLGFVFPLVFRVSQDCDVQPVRTGQIIVGYDLKLPLMTPGPCRLILGLLKD